MASAAILSPRPVTIKPRGARRGDDTMKTTTKKKPKAKTEAQRKRLGVANPGRTQDARDRLAFFRYVKKHPDVLDQMLGLRSLFNAHAEEATQ
jgi:hypothetical protein